MVLWASSLFRKIPIFTLSRFLCPVFWNQITITVKRLRVYCNKTVHALLSSHFLHFHHYKKDFLCDFCMTGHNLEFHSYFTTLFPPCIFIKLFTKKVLTIKHKFLPYVTPNSWGGHLYSYTWWNSENNSHLPLPEHHPRRRLTSASNWLQCSTWRPAWRRFSWYVYSDG
jgi:hypothetical protein